MPEAIPALPFDLLRVIAIEEVAVTPTLRHIEVYTMTGLLTFLWHGKPDAERVLLLCGGAMGGLLGPAGGLYHDLGEGLAADGIATIRVGYRRPNDVLNCMNDVGAAADVAHRQGAQRFAIVGHSFGGAVAINAGVALRSHTSGVATLATQSAGCETAGQLEAPLLLIHGDADELLPVTASQTVQAIAKRGELVVLPGVGHLFSNAKEELRTRLFAWVREVLPA